MIAGMRERRARRARRACESVFAMERYKQRMQGLAIRLFRPVLLL